MNKSCFDIDILRNILMWMLMMRMIVMGMTMSVCWFMRAMIMVMLMIKLIMRFWFVKMLFLLMMRMLTWMMVSMMFIAFIMMMMLLFFMIMIMLVIALFRMLMLNFLMMSFMFCVNSNFSRINSMVMSTIMMFVQRWMKYLTHHHINYKSKSCCNNHC